MTTYSSDFLNTSETCSSATHELRPTYQDSLKRFDSSKKLRPSPQNEQIDKSITLVLSGNATNAVLVLGALQYIHETQCDLSTITYFGATSSGAMISILLMLNYEPIEILIYLCTSKLYNKLYLNFSGGIVGKPLSDFKEIEESIKFLIKKKWTCAGTSNARSEHPTGATANTKQPYQESDARAKPAAQAHQKNNQNGQRSSELRSEIPTLKEFETVTKKTFICTTYNLTDDKREYISSKSHPNLLITDAIKMTCAVPFLFGPCLINNKYYLDGGLFDNFPLNYMIKNFPDNKNYAVLTSTTKKPYSPDQPFSDYLWKLFSIFKSTIHPEKFHKFEYTQNQKIIQLLFDGGFLTFESTNSDLLRFFDAGYNLCESYINVR